jgi:hypothetical protein
MFLLRTQVLQSMKHVAPEIKNAIFLQSFRA